MITSTVPIPVDISMISHWDCCNSFLTVVLDSILCRYTFLNAQIKMTFSKCKLIYLKTFLWLPFFSQNKSPTELCLIWLLIASLILSPTILSHTIPTTLGLLRCPEHTRHYFLHREIYTYLSPFTPNICISVSKSLLKCQLFKQIYSNYSI